MSIRMEYKAQAEYTDGDWKIRVREHFKDLEDAYTFVNISIDGKCNIDIPLDWAKVLLECLQRVIESDHAE